MHTERLHTKRLYTGRRYDWTKTCRLGVTTMQVLPPCSSTTCKNKAWNTRHPACFQKRFARRLEHVPAERTCCAELFSKKFDPYLHIHKALTRWAGLDKTEQLSCSPIRLVRVTSTGLSACRRVAPSVLTNRDLETVGRSNSSRPLVQRVHHVW